MGFRFNVGLDKKWTLNDRWRLTTRQGFSIRPEFNRIDDDRFDDALDDLFLIPGAELDDDEETNAPPVDRNNAGAVLDDGGMDFDLDLSGATQFDLAYEILEDLRISGQYGLYYQPDRLRHGWTTLLRYTLPLASKTLRLNSTAALQHTGESRKDGFRLRSGIRTGVRIQYRKSKTHRPYAGADFTGRWRDGEYKWDRYRLRVGMSFSPEDENYDFRFEYRYTKRIGSDRFNHDFRISCGVDF